MMDESTLFVPHSNQLCSVLIGNVEGALPPDDPLFVISSPVVEQVQSVQTRAAASQKIHPLTLPNLKISHVCRPRVHPSQL